jgi:hypothetical protein
LADERGWLKGAVRPCYKNPVGTLPSGAKVMAVGDTANSMDPIGGQGANNCYRQIRVLLEAVRNNAEGNYSEDWMTSTFDTYYEEIGKATNAFNNILLEPLTPAGIRMLCSQYGSSGDISDVSVQQKIANDFVDNFDNPNLLTDCFVDDAKAKAYIDSLTGGKSSSTDLKAKMSIALGQLRQVLGKPRNQHPLASPRLVRQAS